MLRSSYREQCRFERLTGRRNTPSGASLPRPRDRVYGFPIVEASLTDPVFTAHIGSFYAGLVLLQDRNDLLFRVPLSLHRLVLSPRARLRFVLDQFKGATSRRQRKRSPGRAERRRRQQELHACLFLLIGCERCPSRNSDAGAGSMLTSCRIRRAVAVSQRSNGLALSGSL